MDVDVVTQKLAPLIAGRFPDKTVVFDTFGTSSRPARPPSKLIVLCIDCSYSMSESPGLLKEDEDELVTWDRHIGSSAAWADEKVQGSTVRSLKGQYITIPIA